MTDKEIIEKAAELAKEHGRKHGLKIGTIVAHSSRDDAMKLVRIDRETGIVRIHPRFSHTGKEEETSFPLGELFDANLALQCLVHELASNLGLASLTRHFKS